jgi:hypothetical protein
MFVAAEHYKARAGQAFNGVPAPAS